jgi:hypothetical protein
MDRFLNSHAEVAIPAVRMRTSGQRIVKILPELPMATARPATDSAPAFVSQRLARVALWRTPASTTNPEVPLSILSDGLWRPSLFGMREALDLTSDEAP